LFGKKRDYQVKIKKSLLIKNPCSYLSDYKQILSTFDVQKAQVFGKSPNILSYM